MAFTAEDVPLKPLTDYEDYVTQIRKYGEELGQDIVGGMNPNEAVGRYNEKMDNLEDEFVTVRVKDYDAVRQVEQMPQLQASHEPAGLGEPRHTSYSPAKYEAPEDMTFDTYDFNIQSQYGDCHAYIDIQLEGQVVIITLTARARHRPQGTSHIIANPIIVWRFDSEGSIDNSKADFDTLERLADDRYFIETFRG